MILNDCNVEDGDDGDKDDDEDDDYAMDANWHISRQVLPQATSAFPVTALLPHTTAYPSPYCSPVYSLQPAKPNVRSATVVPLTFSDGIGLST